MSIPLKARRDFPYAGKRVKKGQDFDARSASDARLLKAIGHAEDPYDAPLPNWTLPAQYKTRVMTAEQPAQAQSIPLVTKSEDDLDAMDAEALHALASNMGVYIHHRAGAERARQVIREHRKQSAE